jgi:hypothetical protein
MVDKYFGGDVKRSRDWLIKLDEEGVTAEWDDLGQFCCLVPCGPGYDINPAGYVRCNLAGGKHMVHKVVLLLTKPRPAPKIVGGNVVQYEVSHLCGNPSCCRASHLEWETRADNIARRGCIGVILVDGVHWSTCSHDPRCKTSKEAVKIE